MSFVILTLRRQFPMDDKRKENDYLTQIVIKFRCELPFFSLSFSCFYDSHKYENLENVII